MRIYQVGIVKELDKIWRTKIEEKEIDEKTFNQFKWDKLNRWDFPESNRTIMATTNKDFLIYFCSGIDQILDIIENGFIPAGQTKNFEGKNLI